MFLKTYSSNLYDFFDFCLAVLYNFPSEDAIERILFGKHLNLLHLISDSLMKGINKWNIQIVSLLHMVIEKWVT